MVTENTLIVCSQTNSDENVRAGIALQANGKQEYIYHIYWAADKPPVASLPSEIGNLAPDGSGEAIWMIGLGVDDRLGAGDDIRNQMPRSGADAEAVAGKSSGENEARQRGNFADTGDAC